ncbi:MAG: hypothetical protein OJI70_03345 [Zavarzinia sp.]|nr:hypothetical protein [Zavarzinia sp.]
MLRLLPAALASLLLAGLAALQIALPTDDLPAAEDGLAPRRPALIDVPPAEDYPAILARPLFSPDRRPAAGDTDTAQGDAFAVIGIGTTAEAATALLRVGEREVRRIRPGDTVNGWTVTGIEPGAVTLTRDGESLRLALGGAAAPEAQVPETRVPEARAPTPAAMPEDRPDTAPEDFPDDAAKAPPPRPGAAPHPDKSWLPPAMQSMPGIERFIEK